MAGKSRRVAARQSQLNRRRKKQQRGPSGIPVGVPQAADPADEEGATASDGAVASTPPTPGPRAPGPRAPGPRAPGQPAPARSSSSSPQAATATERQRPASRSRANALAREEAAPAHQYMGQEIRRILAMAGTAFAVLVVLKFVL